MGPSKGTALVEVMPLARLSRAQLVVHVCKIGDLKIRFELIGRTEIGKPSAHDDRERIAGLEAIEHVHHAGNSSGIVDGAAAILVGNERFGADNGLKPRARIRSFASVGSEPTIMLTGPADAARSARH